MNMHNIDSITSYNNFLKHLNPFGVYQKKLALICSLFWLFSGMTRTIFDKQVFLNVNQQLPFLSLATIIGLFVGSYLSNYYKRNKILVGLSILFVLGSIILITCPAIKNISIYMISFSQFSLCICASCIVFQSVNVQIIPILAWIFIFLFHVAKLGSIFIFHPTDQNQHQQLILGSIILLIGILKLAGSFLFRQSLRYLIDNDIQEAEILALKISQENNCTDQKILNIIEGSFIWNKVNIKKYGISCFTKYKSLAQETYYLGTSFFCLGIFGKFALVIFEINERKKNIQFEQEVQLIWIGIFSLLGFLPGINNYKIYKRRTVCLITAIIATIISLILLGLVKFSNGNNGSVVAIFALLGINSFLQSALFFFMFLQSIEFYPHTIRTLGISLCICFYFLGQLAFNLHFYFIKDQQSSFELILSSSFLMVFHIFNISETYQKGINYQIKQIQERQMIQD